MSEKANYVTCPKGHKVYVIWSEQRQKFGFTCDECGEHSEVAISPKGAIRIQRVGGRA
jgi:hypothetical protein